MYQIPYSAIFDAFFNTKLNRFPALLCLSSDYASIIYCWNQDRTGLVGKHLKTDAKFNRSTFVSDYTPTRKLSYVYDTSRTGNQLIPLPQNDNDKYSISISNQFNNYQQVNLRKLVPVYLHLNIKPISTHPHPVCIVAPRKHYRIVDKVEDLSNLPLH